MTPVSQRPGPDLTREIRRSKSEKSSGNSLRRYTKVELQNLFIATACNVKRWLRMLAEAQIGSKSQRLPFSKFIQWIPRFFRTIRLRLNLLPRSSQVALFLAHA
jgi:hypothetical protein